MELNCWYECIHGCGTRYSIFDVVYHCETCGGLLEVKHDLAALKQRAADEWKALFVNRSFCHRLALRQRRVGQKGMDLPLGGG